MGSYVKKGGHGGKRRGAGRKAVIDNLSRHRLGAICEHRWRELTTESALARHKAHLERRGIDKKPTPIRQLPQEKRRYVSAPDVEPDDLPQNLADAAFELQDTNEALNTIGRYNTYILRRPQCARTEILEGVAREASDYHGRKITPRMIAQCWTDYRKLKQALREDTDC